jgi:hypothetical protein
MGKVYSLVNHACPLLPGLTPRLLPPFSFISRPLNPPSKSLPFSFHSRASCISSPDRVPGREPSLMIAIIRLTRLSPFPRFAITLGIESGYFLYRAADFHSDEISIQLVSPPPATISSAIRISLPASPSSADDAV